MPTEVFDDGTTLTTDAADNVVSFTDASGASFTPDKSVTQDYVSSFLTSIAPGVTQALKNAFTPSVNTPAAGAPVAPVSPLASLLKFAPLAALVFAGFKLFK